MKVSLTLMFTLVLLSSIIQGAVYEARNSDDVDFFLAHNPEENGALMFYDPVKEQNDQATSDSVNKVIGIFKNIGEEGRTQEAWVNDLNDKVHLMRVDATNMDNARSVQEYKVGKTPLLILLDYGNVILMEAVTEKSYDHVKDVLEQKSEEKKKQQQDAAKKAETSGLSKEDQNKELAEAQKAAEDALKALEEVRKAFEEHLAVEKAREDAEDAKKKAEQAQKGLDEANKKVNGGSGDSSKTDGKSGSDDKCPSGSSQDNKNQNTQQKQPVQNQQQNDKCSTGANQGQNQGQQPVHNLGSNFYIPVYTRLNQPQVVYPAAQPAQTTQPTRVLHGDHWHIVDQK